MAGRCFVCGNTRQKDRSISLHRLPSSSDKRKQWLEALKLNEVDIKTNARICNRNFRGGDARKALAPDINLGKRFASPRKQWTARAERAKGRETKKSPLESNNCVTLEWFC